MDESAARQLIHAFMQFDKAYRYGDVYGRLRRSEMLLLYSLIRCEEKGKSSLKVSELSRLLHVTSPTVTQAINELEGRKLVRRTMDPSDRRAVRVEITEHGRETITQEGAQVTQSFYGLVDYLGEAESQHLASLLTKVITYYKELHESEVQQSVKNGDGETC